MSKYNLQLRIFFLTAICFVLFGWTKSSEAANHYVIQSGTGSKNGSDWNNAFASLPANLARGDTYYLADGNYASYTFDDANSGTSVITVKKATIADHGTNTGWSDDYGNGQAIFGDLTFSTSYWTLDGNGTHTIPSRNTNDYGIKVSVDTNTGHIVHVASGQSNITLRYVHSYNAQQGGDCSHNGDNRNLYFAGVNYVKVQNCFIDGSFQDGIVTVGTDHLLIERSYLQRLGMLEACPGNDSHGQAIAVWSGTNQVYRWNIFNDNDGQGVIGLSEDMANVRTYGNVFFNEHLAGPLYQGINGGYWDYYDNSQDDTFTNNYIYNNSFVNVGNPYPANRSAIIYAHGGATMLGNSPVHNNLFYAINGGGLLSGNFSTNSYSAYGNCTDTPGGTNVQSGLTAANFQNYSGFDFRLSGHTAPGLDVSSQPWWNSGADAFFGQLDYNTDMYGTVRNTWDRGAFEYASGSGGDTTPPAAPSGLSVN